MHVITSEHIGTHSTPNQSSHNKTGMALSSRKLLQGRKSQAIEVRSKPRAWHKKGLLCGQAAMDPTGACRAGRELMT